LPDCIKVRVKYNYSPPGRPEGRNTRSKENPRPKARHRTELTYPLSRVMIWSRVSNVIFFTHPPIDLFVTSH
jgi:hypothetical protein